MSMKIISIRQSMRKASRMSSRGKFDFGHSELFI